MIIFFKKITFKKKYLLWEYNSDTDKAYCLYRTIEKQKEKQVDRVEVLRFLEDTEFKGFTIEIHGGNAIIQNVSELSFNKADVKRRASLNGTDSLVYPSKQVSINNNNINNTNFTTPHKFGRSKSDNSQSRFFNAKLSSTTDSNFNIEDSGSLSNEDLKFFSIELNSLISVKKAEELCGVNLSYKDDLYLRSPATFHNELQVTKKRNLTQLKSGLLKLIEDLLVAFNHQFKSWQVKLETKLEFKELKELRDYFRTSVFLTMDSSKFDIIPIQIEQLSSETHFDLFKGNQHQYDYMLLQAWSLSANARVINWQVLYSDQHDLKLSSIDPESKGYQSLMSFKEHILKDTNEVSRIEATVNKLAQRLSELLKTAREIQVEIDKFMNEIGACPGLEGDDKSYVKKLIIELNNRTYNSLYSVINECVPFFFEQGKKDVSQKIVSGCAQVLSQVIDLLIKDNLLIVDSKFPINDVYLYKDWAISVKAALMHLNEGKIKKNSPNSRRSGNFSLDELSANIFRVIKEKKLELLLSSEHEEKIHLRSSLNM